MRDASREDLYAFLRGCGSMGNPHATLVTFVAVVIIVTWGIPGSSAATCYDIFVRTPYIPPE